MPKQKGGKFIAKGTYGCVYGNVRKSCVDEDVLQTDDGNISKQMNYQEAIIEKQEMETIDMIDPSFNFHLKTERTCLVNPKQLEENKEECSIPHADHLLIQESGGMSLRQLSKSLSTDAYSRIKITKSLLNGFIPIFEGLMTMSNHGYLHNDIKLDNIVCKINEDMSEFDIKLIDFGAMSSYKLIIDEPQGGHGFHWAPYGINPPESSLISFISEYRDYLKDEYKPDLSITIIQHFEMLVLKKLNAYYHFHRGIFGEPLHLVTYQSPYYVDTYFNKIMNRITETDDVDKNFYNFSIKILSFMDSYALGIAMSQLFTKMFGTIQELESPEKEYSYDDMFEAYRNSIEHPVEGTDVDIVNLYIDCMKYLLHPDIDERKDIFGIAEMINQRNTDMELGLREIKIQERSDPYHATAQKQQEISSAPAASGSGGVWMPPTQDDFYTISDDDSSSPPPQSAFEGYGYDTKPQDTSGGKRKRKMKSKRKTPKKKGKSKKSTLKAKKHRKSLRKDRGKQKRKTKKDTK